MSLGWELSQNINFGNWVNMNVLQLFKSFLVICGFAACLFVAGCETPTNSTKPNSAVAGSKDVPVAPPDDPLKVGDKIKVDYPTSGEKPMLPHEETIKDDGTIHLDLIGDVKAAGLNPRQLERAIHEKYVPAFYNRLTVVVTPDSRYFYVGGEVKQPNRQLYTGNMTVVRAIQSSGDFTDFADRKKVILLRANGDRKIINVIEARKDPKKDLPVYPGDSIHVPQSPI
ncbi:MAG: polysaccharide export protein [Verrucomicrobiales bacterium]|nr:polysaccharide export protein [Verrucomicrobiales bacterium]MDB6131618.1 polysaccharide export protein [Verrucomicrobiales bacterium]